VALVRSLVLACSLTAAVSLGASAGSLAATGKPTGSKHRHAKPRPPAEVTLGPGLTSRPGAPVTMAPVGLSLEYPVMAAALGGEACPPPALTAELQRLGSPPIQLGGQSQDFTAPSGAGASVPSSWESLTSYTLPAAFWGRLHCLLAAAGGPLTVGLNARAGQLAWAQQMVAEARAAATDGVSFSLGNEPDLYYLPNFGALDKPQAAEEATAAGLYLKVAGYLEQAVGEAAVIGPETSGPSRWRGALPGVIASLHERMVGIHMYPLTTCRTPRAVTISGLLSAGVGASAGRLAWVAADAKAAGIPAIITEANSASCGGKAGVSDSPAAAVWAARFVLAALKTGFAEVRFHFSGDPYDPFLVRGGAILARPLEAALAALNRWLPIGASFRTIAGVRGFLATAISTSSGAPLLILDNEQGKAQPVVIRGARGIRVQSLSSARAGLQEELLSSPAARIRVGVEANSVLTVTATP
jgi:hypothetical protein